jgi:hypothetical protein
MTLASSFSWGLRGALYRSLTWSFQWSILDMQCLNYVLGVSVAFLVVAVTVARATPPDFPEHVDDAGNITLPEDFRARLVHLGSWFVPGGEASGFHDVYTEARTVDVYRRTGRFPDGATLVKELRASDAGNYTTGQGVSHSTPGIKQWFVMVKDGGGHFPEHKSWGDGWGWALVTLGSDGRNISTDYKADCLGCHIPARDTDFIYVEAYPTLAGQ